MLTVDDANTIIEKYGKSGFWYSIDCSKFDLSKIPTQGSYGKDFYYGPIKVNLSNGDTSSTMSAKFYRGSFVTPLMYISNDEGIISDLDVREFTAFVSLPEISRETFKEMYFNVFITANPPTFIQLDFSYYLFLPLSPLQIPVVNGEFDEKFYIDPIGVWQLPPSIDGEVVTLEEDEKGKYFILPSAENCVIGTKNGDFNCPLYNVTFREFKTLPILSIPTIYKGNTQTIQLFNDTEEITEFQAYYKGELLTDNKITLPYDAEDYIDITVDLLDNRYPNSTLKLKAPTQMYIASTQSEVESAISQGITTLQVGDTETEVLLNGIDLTQVTLVNSNIQLTNSTINNCTILNSQYTDNGANTITNTVIRNTDYTNTSKSTYEDTSFYNSSIQDSELQITGTIYECELTNSLIISDGTININNNTFTGIGSKTYFPSHLYLTGDYIVSGNTFNLTGTFTELQFNMCLIKATNDFNVGDFINKNTFQLNITYESEPTSTLYYNIVDDDKIRARRV